MVSAVAAMTMPMPWSLPDWARERRFWSMSGRTNGSASSTMSRLGPDSDDEFVSGRF
jgi:hypothetical protein